MGNINYLTCCQLSSYILTNFGSIHKRISISISPLLNELPFEKEKQFVKVYEESSLLILDTRSDH